MPASLGTRLLPPLLAMLLLLACPAVSKAQDVDEVGADSDEPEQLFNRGQDAHARGQLERALALYDAALKLKPDFAEAEFQKGSALVALKRPAEAEVSLRRAAELKKDWALPQSALGFLLLQSGRGSEAEPVLRRAAALDPKNTRTIAALADLRLRAGATAEALKLIRQVTEAEGATASDWTLRATVERKTGDDAAAAASLARALALDPRGFEALALRADLRAAAGHFAAALEDLRAAFSSAPESARPALARRSAEIEAASKISDCGEQAIPALEDLLGRDPKNASAHACLGAAARKADPAKSLAHYRAAAELEPKSAKYATGYAAALVQLRRFAEAAAVLRRVLAVAPEDYAAHANLATALDELKLYDEAVAEYKWLARARPELAVVHFLIGRDYDLLGEYKLALQSYEAFLAQADPAQNQLEIEKVNLRLPIVRDNVKRGLKPMKRGR